MSDVQGQSANEVKPGASGVVRALQALLLVLVVGIVYLVVTTPKETSLDPNARQMPAFEMQTMDGSTLTNADLKGKITVFNFFATWCGPCRAEMPELVRFSDAWQGRGVQVVGVSAGYDSEALLAPFLRQYRVQYPIMIGGEGLLDAMGFSTLPTTVIVDEGGRVATVWEGSLNRDMLERALAGVGQGGQP